VALTQQPLPIYDARLTVRCPSSSDIGRAAVEGVASLPCVRDFLCRDRYLCGDRPLSCYVFLKHWEHLAERLCGAGKTASRRGIVSLPHRLPGSWPGTSGGGCLQVTIALEPRLRCENCLPSKENASKTCAKPASISASGGLRSRRPRRSHPIPKTAFPPPCTILSGRVACTSLRPVTILAISWARHSPRWSQQT